MKRVIHRASPRGSRSRSTCADGRAGWVRRIAAAAGWKGEIVPLSSDRLPAHLKDDHDYAQDWALDSNRIRRELDYVEPTSAETAMARTIEWERDPDFGYLVAASVPGIDDEEVLQPRKLYEREGRLDEYDAHVERLKRERAEFLGGFPSLSDEIVAAVR